MFFFLLRSCLLGSLSGFNKSAATSAKCFFLSEMNANRFQTLFYISLLWGYTLEESSFVLDKLVTLTACFSFFLSHLLCFVNFYGKNRWVLISQHRFCIGFKWSCELSALTNRKLWLTCVSYIATLLTMNNGHFFGKRNVANVLWAQNNPVVMSLQVAHYLIFFRKYKNLVYFLILKMSHIILWLIMGIYYQDRYFSIFKMMMDYWEWDFGIEFVLEINLEIGPEIADRYRILI